VGAHLGREVTAVDASLPDGNATYARRCPRGMIAGYRAHGIPAAATDGTLRSPGPCCRCRRPGDRPSQLSGRRNARWTTLRWAGVVEQTHLRP
jgi:hypothetical protein